MSLFDGSCRYPCVILILGRCSSNVGRRFQGSVSCLLVRTPPLPLPPTHAMLTPWLHAHHVPIFPPTYLPFHICFPFLLLCVCFWGWGGGVGSLRHVTFSLDLFYFLGKNNGECWVDLVPLLQLVSRLK